MGTAVLLVLIVSLSIFAARGNFGEALLSLVGGLLTVFAFEWTVSRYVAFSTAWLGFALSAMLISSVKLAAKVEDILRQAALRLVEASPELEATEKNLRTIASTTPLKMLGPIERAEVIRLLAFRNLPMNLFSPCLAAVESLSVLTEVETKTITILFADFLLSSTPETDTAARSLVDILYDAIKESPVPPEDFFSAFEGARRLLVSKALSPQEFLKGLRDCLSSGVAPGDVYEELRARSEK